MVCHETYKDQKNNWLSPDEVYTEDGKKFFDKETKNTVKVGPSESMSKSKKNTIDPEEMINNYGADAVRLFIMSDSPPEKDVQWSNEGMEGSFKFIQKLWSLHKKFIEKIDLNQKDVSDKELSKFTNSLILKITQNLESFRYNVIIANFYEMYNFLNKELENPISKDCLIENYNSLLNLLNPFVPHLSSECLSQISKYKAVQENWPLVKKEFLINEKVNLVVQINGKKREILVVKKDTNKQNIINMVNENKKLNNFIKGKKIIKEVFIPNKIINLIIK
jgi:leucyl-tRNA synthetase